MASIASPDTQTAASAIASMRVAGNLFYTTIGQSTDAIEVLTQAANLGDIVADKDSLILAGAQCAILLASVYSGQTINRAIANATLASGAALLPVPIDYIQEPIVVPPLAALGSFTLVLDTPSLSIVQGSSAVVTMKLASTGRYAATNTLSVSGTTPGITASFAVLTVPDGTGSVPVTIAASISAMPGTTTLTLAAGDSTITRSATVTLTVTPSPTYGVGNFTIGVTPID